MLQITNGGMPGHRQIPEDGHVAAMGAVIARNIRAERARRRWSQADLADKIGVSPQTISAIEVGRRRISIDDLVDICRALGVTQAKLMEGADPAAIAALG